MKSVVVLALFVGFLVVGCDGCDGYGSKAQSKGFMSNLADCSAVYTNCVTECKGPDCADRCENARGMCNVQRVRRCMQQCNVDFGKNTSSADTCKRNCNLMRSQ